MVFMPMSEEQIRHLNLVENNSRCLRISGDEWIHQDRPSVMRQMQASVSEIGQFHG